MALDTPLWKTVLGQKYCPKISKIWSKINDDLKIVLTTISFTHTLKKEILNNLIIWKNKIITIIIVIITILNFVFVIIITIIY